MFHRQLRLLYLCLFKLILDKDSFPVILTIQDMQEGSNGWVLEFTNDLIAGRMLSMGVLPGSAVSVIRRAPFSGGVYVKVDGNNMVMRCNEAKCILLTTENPVLQGGVGLKAPAAG